MNQTPILIDDDLWEELVELTDGAAAVCYQCGVCTAICPWGLVKKEVFSVREYMRQAQLGIQPEDEDLWLCTTCGQCEAYCPRGVKVTEVIGGLRYLAWKHNQPLAGLPSLLWSVYWNNNPWDQPPSQRTQWARQLAIPEFDPGQHEILYYVGCAASYETRAQKVAESIVRVLQAVGIPFGTLGEQEPCSGEEVLSVGHQPYFQEIAERTRSLFKARGVTHVITSDPHSYDAFKNYSQIDDFAVPQHYTQFFADLIGKGQLTFKSMEHTNPGKITFHDPCYLARHNAETEAARKVLEAIPGVTLVEMRNHGIDTLCCGGGGGRMWIDTAAGERFSDLRVMEALETGADILATACPYCISCLEDSVKAKEIKNLRVMDVAEIAAANLP
jgi:Fe-S oxidoreductase